jgi:site-specific DNA recombinase
MLSKKSKIALRLIFRRTTKWATIARRCALIPAISAIVTKCRDTKVAKYNGGIPFTYGPSPIS